MLGVNFDQSETRNTERFILCGVARVQDNKANDTFAGRFLPAKRTFINDINGQGTSAIIEGPGLFNTKSPQSTQ